MYFEDIFENVTWILGDGDVEVDAVGILKTEVGIVITGLSYIVVGLHL